ncbi:ribosomal RNA small subunit methyltransferase A [bacterium]|nr:ribosomal RNA small subunit methyltransferase A [bacterium]|tara:strand:+ start:92 stop:961 length:870 start_codon:yes stop_codon:yes gene_type:complete
MLERKNIEMATMGNRVGTLENFLNLNMRAKKHLGQHFLTSKAALRDIVEAARVQKGDVVLEVGPGRGVLTRSLLDTGARVVAIEADADMIDVLEKTFAEEMLSDQLLLVKSDVLKIHLTTAAFRKWGVSKYKLVANIPYYITGAFLRRFLTAQMQPSSMTILVQKEVAERIAKDKKETVLSLSVKAFGVPRYVSLVPARYFNPPPKVDSAILHIDSISRNFFADVDEKRFFKIVKAGFASKRKKLVNNLTSFGSKEDVRKVMHGLGLTENARPEDVHLEEWRDLSLRLK